MPKTRSQALVWIPTGLAVTVILGVPAIGFAQAAPSPPPASAGSATTAPPAPPPAPYPYPPPPTMPPPPGYGYPYPVYPGYPPYPGYAPYPVYPPAPPRPLPAGYRTHDGMYLRMNFGIGFTQLTARADGMTVEGSDNSVHFGTAVGGAVFPNLILYGQFILTTLSSAEVTVNGQAFGNANNDVNLIGLGPGVAYYFAGPNVFIAETVALTQIYTDDANVAVRESEWGWSLETLIGKEWWVSQDWGLGIAGQFVFGKMKAKPIPGMTTSVPTWTAISGGLLFSATYN